MRGPSTKLDDIFWTGATDDEDEAQAEGAGGAGGANADVVAARKSQKAEGVDPVAAIAAVSATASELQPPAVSNWHKRRSSIQKAQELISQDDERRLHMSKDEKKALVDLGHWRRDYVDCVIEFETLKFRGLENDFLSSTQRQLMVDYESCLSESKAVYDAKYDFAFDYVRQLGNSCLLSLDTFLTVVHQLAKGHVRA